MLGDSPGKTVKQVLIDDFSRVSPNVAEEICKAAKVSPKKEAATIHSDEAERLHKALGEVKLMAPSASSVVPIGEALLVEGLKRRFKAELYVSTTRPPAVYRGNPFVVEVGLAFGGDLPTDEPAEIIRLANRVPLQYQPKACAISEAVYETNWKSYEVAQPKGSLPVAPLAIAVHLASVWVPFTSEAKEAVAHYDELMKELKLAIQECGRKLGAHLRAREKALSEHRRLSIFQRYIPEVSQAISNIIGVPKTKVQEAFTSALSNFVNVAEEAPPEGSSAPPAPSMPPPADSVPPPAAVPTSKAKGGAKTNSKAQPSEAASKPGKASKRGKGSQLELI
jgi:DNA topoisomerase-6 subunit B